MNGEEASVDPILYTFCGIVQSGYQKLYVFSAVAGVLKDGSKREDKYPSVDCVIFSASSNATLTQPKDTGRLP